jgi:hypothetical protein
MRGVRSWSVGLERGLLGLGSRWCNVVFSG